MRTGPDATRYGMVGVSEGGNGDGDERACKDPEMKRSPGSVVDQCEAMV